LSNYLSFFGIVLLFSNVKVKIKTPRRTRHIIQNKNMKNMQNMLAVLVIFYGQVANAIFSVDCTTLVTTRTDPIVFPNAYPAGHVHSVVGASAFSHSATFDTIRASACTTCNVPQDLSAYWVPQLYVKKADSGKYVSLPNEIHVSYIYIENNDHANANDNVKCLDLL
jgi:hypothetical protein